MLLFLNKNCKGYEIINLNKKIENYIYKINSNISEIDCKKISNAILKQSEYYNIPWIITLAIIEAESTFNKYALSNVGAKGLMQVYTLECFGIIADKNRLFEIEYNIAFGLCILQDKLRMSNNDYKKAIYMYNGEGKEARKYVKKILKTIKKIRRIFYESQRNPKLCSDNRFE